jgi:hypothetical protein
VNDDTCLDDKPVITVDIIKFMRVNSVRENTKEGVSAYV